MIQLLNDQEKLLWRKAAVAALDSIERVESEGNKKVALFAVMVADGIINSYRKRCGFNTTS